MVMARARGRDGAMAFLFGQLNAWYKIYTYKLYCKGSYFV